MCNIIKKYNSINTLFNIFSFNKNKIIKDNNKLLNSDLFKSYSLDSFNKSNNICKILKESNLKDLKFYSCVFKSIVKKHATDNLKIIKNLNAQDIILDNKIIKFKNFENEAEVLHAFLIIHITVSAQIGNNLLIGTKTSYLEDISLIPFGIEKKLSVVSVSLDYKLPKFYLASKLYLLKLEKGESIFNNRIIE